MQKQAYINALAAFIAQRSGITRHDYASEEGLQGDYRPMIRHGNYARCMLRIVELTESITVNDLIEASNRAFSGRLQFIQRGNKIGVDYTTGQYFPTEYRRATCAVLSYVLIQDWRNKGIPREGIQKHAREVFGRGIANEWFN